MGGFGAAVHFDGTGWTRVETGVRAQLERVRTNTLPDGGREVIMIGEHGTVLRKRY